MRVDLGGEHEKNSKQIQNVETGMKREGSFGQTVCDFLIYVVDFARIKTFPRHAVITSVNWNLPK